MGAMTNGGPEGTLRRVVSRERFPNYTSDTLECGHVVSDSDNRRPDRRRCLACAEAMAAIFDPLFAGPHHCLACGAPVEGGGKWCSSACGREVLRARPL